MKAVAVLTRACHRARQSLQSRDVRASTRRREAPEALGAVRRERLAAEQMPVAVERA